MNANAKLILNNIHIFVEGQVEVGNFWIGRLADELGIDSETVHGALRREVASGTIYKDSNFNVFKSVNPDRERARTYGETLNRLTNSGFASWKKGWLPSIIKHVKTYSVEG